jgi:hypothetical protein
LARKTDPFHNTMEAPHDQPPGDYDAVDGGIWRVPGSGIGCKPLWIKAQ